MRRTLVMAAAALAGTGFAPAARAQALEAPRHRQGYYTAFGMQGLVSSVREDGEGLGPWAGSAFSIRFGQLITRRLGLGLSISVGGSAGGGQSASLFGLGVEGQWEVGPNLALRGGIGLAVVSLSRDDDPAAALRGTYGAGYHVGASWDWFVTRARLTGGLAITPVVEIRVVPENSVQTFSGLLGVELSWWTGLPRNQLELSGADAYKR